MKRHIKVSFYNFWQRETIKETFSIIELSFTNDPFDEHRTITFTLLGFTVEIESISDDLFKQL